MSDKITTVLDRINGSVLAKCFATISAAFLVMLFALIVFVLIKLINEKEI